MILILILYFSSIIFLFKKYNFFVIDYFSGIFKIKLLMKYIKKASRSDKEAMFLDYSELLNSLDPRSNSKITILNRRLNRVDFEKNIMIPKILEASQYT